MKTTPACPTRRTLLAAAAGLALAPKLRAQSTPPLRLATSTPGGGFALYGEAATLRILFAMYPSPGMLALPAASKVQRLEDLRGQRVVLACAAVAW